MKFASNWNKLILHKICAFESKKLSFLHDENGVMRKIYKSDSGTILPLNKQIYTIYTDKIDGVLIPDQKRLEAQPTRSIENILAEFIGIFNFSN